MVKITKEDFMKYVKVQTKGLYNMFDERARKLTGLAKDKYLEIISNYSKYAKQFGKGKK